MDRQGVNGTLHEQVAEALERGARAQAYSRALLEDHMAVEAAVQDTLARIGRRRERERTAAGQE